MSRLRSALSDRYRIEHELGQGGMATVYLAPTFGVISRDTLFRDDYVYATNPHANYDVAPDGQIVVLQPMAEGKRVVVGNWRQVLRRAMRPAETP